LKAKSYASLKRKLDSVFSEWTRRSCSNSRGLAACVTCGKVRLWKHQQCGHFIPRLYLAGRWNPDNCFVQCPLCNVFKHGNYPEFSAYLIRTFGAEKIDALLALKRETVKFTRADLQAKIDFYKAQIEALK